ncbi:group III truncated hemoglobin [Falsirhodobacter xinxiangensis]|uniref:group III truncated hemoglobin n=1 Tax=Falsirhodobacter xinxiangensis TaxID=2530049 RepID=UPI0010AA2664|nr:group III truncated hemoglobin [Rhodobacter xinxiangensis]
MMPPRFPVTSDQIDIVVADFYARVRSDAVLGPIFAAHVTDWTAHEGRIAAFWRNAILYDRGYEGSPMMAHRRAGDVRPDHFPRWLALFETALHARLPVEVAAAWSALAHRIGAGLRMGVADRADGPPSLR